MGQKWRFSIEGCIILKPATGSMFNRQIYSRWCPNALISCRSSDNVSYTGWVLSELDGTCIFVWGCVHVTFWRRVCRCVHVMCTSRFLMIFCTCFLGHTIFQQRISNNMFALFQCTTHLHYSFVLHWFGVVVVAGYVAPGSLLYTAIMGGGPV